MTRARRYDVGLLRAEQGPGPQWKKQKATGSRAEGLAYEKRIGKALPEARHGVWFWYTGIRQSGWCQPDFVIEGQRSILVLEAKLSWRADAHTKLRLLYQPVVGLALGKEAFGVQITKRLRMGMGREFVVVQTLPQALVAAREGAQVVLHWIGEGALVPKEKESKR